MYVISTIPVLIEAHVTQQKLKRQRHRANRYPRQHYTRLPRYCADSSTLPSLILTSTRRVNYNNALCLHDIVKPCLTQCHACCVNSCYILLPVSCFSGADGRRLGKFVVTGGTVGCHYDNLRCRRWRQGCRVDGLLFSVFQRQLMPTAYILYFVPWQAAR